MGKLFNILKSLWKYISSKALFYICFGIFITSGILLYNPLGLKSEYSDNLEVKVTWGLELGFFIKIIFWFALSILILRVFEFFYYKVENQYLDYKEKRHKQEEREKVNQYKKYIKNLSTEKKKILRKYIYENKGVYSRHDVRSLDSSKEAVKKLQKEGMIEFFRPINKRYNDENKYRINKEVYIFLKENPGLLEIEEDTPDLD